MRWPVADRAHTALDDNLGTAALIPLLDQLPDNPRILPGAVFGTFVSLDRSLGLDLPRYLGSAAHP
ncbi:hypothetical protein [Amycolatopsis pigmentata]|uniref:Uncharacterized protein n=1 Tax=Amycolatopsis pigmentata TaxID=450801 RepID=A0ABW5FS59_9PSEU